MTQRTIACIQSTATDDIDADIRKNLAFMREAVDGGATILCLPEFCAGLQVTNGALAPIAFEQDQHPALLAFSDFARGERVDVMVGSVSIREDDRFFNRSVHFDAEGVGRAQYDKIHMFDIDLGHGHRYCESDINAPGDRPVMTEVQGLSAGLSICYDLRFPYLYRHYATVGAEVLFIPAAFTRTTGAAHWHVLLRARAIENGAYVVAAGQCGEVTGGGAMYGHSLIVDPWGRVLADAGPNQCVVQAQIDTDVVRETRSQIPSLKNGRNLFGEL